MGAKLRGALTVESLNGSLSAGQQNITGNISTEEGLEGELSPGIYEYYTRKESRELFATKDVVSTYVTHYERLFISPPKKIRCIVGILIQHHIFVSAVTIATLK